MNTPDKIKVLIRIDPLLMMMVALVAGLVMGALMVLLDPLLRFPGVPLRVNWRETLLSASVMGSYAALLSWLVTTFWRQRMLWVVMLLTAPIVTGIIAGWNNLNAAFGISSDLLLFLPVVVLLHAAAVGLVVLYLQIALRLPQRRRLALTAVPVVMVLLTFLGLGRLRWANQDAKDVMTLLHSYADSTVNGAYSIEYIGIRYQDQLAPTGSAFLHTQDVTLLCQVRLYANNSDISCRPEG